VRSVNCDMNCDAALTTNRLHHPTNFKYRPKYTRSALAIVLQSGLKP
jgi:hypothetical protein